MQTLDEKQQALCDFIRLHGKEQLIKSLREAHDALLYDSNLKIGHKRKDVLHDLKVLADQLEK